MIVLFDSTEIYYASATKVGVLNQAVVSLSVYLLQACRSKMVHFRAMVTIQETDYWKLNLTVSVAICPSEVVKTFLKPKTSTLSISQKPSKFTTKHE